MTRLCYELRLRVLSLSLSTLEHDNPPLTASTLGLLIALTSTTLATQSSKSSWLSLPVPVQTMAKSGYPFVLKNQFVSVDTQPQTDIRSTRQITNFVDEWTPVSRADSESAHFRRTDRSPIDVHHFWCKWTQDKTRQHRQAGFQSC